MHYVGRKSKYNIGDILPDGRKILNITRESETDYRFFLYCDICKTEKWVKRQSGLRRKCSGCGGKIWKHESKEDKVANKSFTNYRHRANKRGHDFTLTRVEFLNIISQRCHWCAFDGLVGVDRLDNNHGYTTENSVPCCKKCNYAKNDMSLEEWSEWIDRVIKKNSR
jgi:hypothetical protein